MRFTVLVLLCAVAVVSCIGCGHRDDTGGDQSAGRVAVIDLDVVARELGRDVQMNDLFEKQASSLNQQMAEVQQSVLKQLNDKERELGAARSDEQTEELLLLQQSASTRLKQVRQQAKSTIDQYKARLIKKFRDEVRTVAQDVAAERGLTLIVTKNETVVFAFSATIDITQEVSNRMIAANPTER